MNFYKLASAECMSKLDAASGFFQISPGKKPEIVQGKISSLLEGLDLSGFP